MTKLTRRLKKKNITIKGGEKINISPLKENMVSFNNAVKSVNDTVGSKVDNIKNAAASATISVADFFNNKVNNFGEWMINSVAHKVEENMPRNVTQRGIEIGENNANKFVDAFANVSKKALGKATKIVKEEMPGIVNAAGTASVSLFETVPFVGAIAAAGTALNKGTESAIRTFDMTDKLQDIVDESLDDVKEIINLDAVENATNAIGNEFEKKSEVLSNATNAIGNEFEKKSEVLSNSIGETSQQIDKGFDKLNDNVSIASSQITRVGGGFKDFSKEKAQIGGRISDSIAAFTDPIGYQSILKGGGGGKNKTSRLVKRNSTKNRKSRRVRFSL
jgi:hypothetical protein